MLDRDSLEAMFGTEEALGVYYADPCNPHNTETDDFVAMLPGVGQMGTCTRCAIYVLARLLSVGASFEDVQLKGFFREDNPTASHTALESVDGHDFAVLSGRYVIDPWISVYSGYENRTVYDLCDPDDAPKILEIYGDPLAWSDVDRDMVLLLIDDAKKHQGVAENTPKKLKL